MKTYLGRKPKINVRRYMAVQYMTERESSLEK